MEISMLYLLVAFCRFSASVTIVEIEKPSVVEVTSDEDSEGFTIDIVRTIHWNYLKRLLFNHDYDNYFKNYSEEYKMNYLSLRKNFGFINLRKYLDFTENVAKKIGEYSGVYIDDEIKLKISKIAKYSDIKKMSNVNRLSWVLEICEQDDKFEVKSHTRIMAFRLYFEVANFGLEKYLEVFGKLRALFYMEAKKKTKEKISSKKNRAIFYSGLRDNLFSMLDMVKDEEWEDLYKIIDPSLKTYGTLLDCVDKRDSRLVEFFNDMIIILKSYREYYSKNDVLELFDILRRILNGKLSQEDYEFICRIYYINHFIEDFKNHFLLTPGEVNKKFSFSKLERNLRPLINE